MRRAPSLHATARPPARPPTLPAPTRPRPPPTLTRLPPATNPPYPPHLPTPPTHPTYPPQSLVERFPGTMDPAFQEDTLTFFAGMAPRLDLLR